MRRKKEGWKTLRAVWACLTVLAVMSSAAYGAPPELPGREETESPAEPAYTAADNNTVSEERLRDGIVEYDELGSLIHYGNLSIQQMTETTERMKQNYQEIRDYLKTERDSANGEKQEAKKKNDMESYGEYAALEAVYSSAAKSYNEMIKKLDSHGANKNRLSVEKQLTKAAQSLMISWQSVELQKEYLEKTWELYEAMYENTKLQQSAGLAAESQVSAAYQDWNAVETRLSGIKDSQASICQSLCSLLGADDTVTLAKIPPVNTEQLTQMDLEEDIQKAIGNNQDIIAERDKKSAGTSSVNKKSRTVDELEEKIKIKMKQLYEEINHKKQEYDAAGTGLEGAGIQWNNAQNQYALGMLSCGEYLREELRYVQKKTEFDSADLALLQALEDYNWAVRGVVTLD